MDSERKVLVGMSGGVDSAAAALLLREAGYEPVGCTLRLYDNEDIGESAEGTCCSLEAVEDAREACRKLGMDHYTFNFSGQSTVDMLGTIYVENKPMPQLDAGIVIRIIEE